LLLSLTFNVSIVALQVTPFIGIALRVNTGKPLCPAEA